MEISKIHRYSFVLNLTGIKMGASRKQYNEKPFHYEFFKKEGKEYLDGEKQLTEAYNEMLKNLTIIYNTK